MDADEKAIVLYLKSWPGQFVSGREISRRAGGKWRFRDNPDWANNALARMVEKRMLESDATGHFRLIATVDDQKAKKPKKWIAPQMRSILEKSGKDFEILDSGDQDDFYTNTDAK